MDGFISDNQPGIQKLDKLKCAFLRAARSGRVDEMKTLMTDPRHGSVSAALWSRGLLAAIYTYQFESLKFLLDMDVPLEDALLHALECQNLEAVEEILIRTQIPGEDLVRKPHLCETLKSSVVNQFAVTQEFPACTTPLKLATRMDDLKAIKMLLNHGATMPTEEEVLAKVSDDHFERSLAKLKLHQALTSEVYILLTADDPIETALTWGEKLADGPDPDHRVFDRSYAEIRQRLELFLTKLLDCASCKDEIWEALNERMAPDGTRRSVLKRGGVKADPLGRLKRVVKLRYKKFISHSYCQEYLLKWWYGKGPIPWARYRTSVRYVMALITAVFFSPLICILNAMLPENVKCVRWFDKLMDTPYVLHIIETTSLIHFVVILTCMTLGEGISQVECPHDGFYRYDPRDHNLTCNEYKYAIFPPGSLFVVVCLWVVGLTWHHVNKIYHKGFKKYIFFKWHLLDVASIALYWIYILTTFSIYCSTNMIWYTFQNDTVVSMQTSRVSLPVKLTYTKYEVSRIAWRTFDPQLVAEICFAVANIFSCLRLLHPIVSFEFVGPVLISFAAIMSDMLRFSCLFAIVLGAFGLGFTQLYAAVATEYWSMCELNKISSGCETSSFDNIGHSIVVFFWALYGESNVSNFALPPNLWLTRDVGLFLFGVYLLLSITIMMNALIAMLSNTYSRVEEQARMEWHFARTRMMLEFDQRMTDGGLPPPFNITPRIGLWVQKGVRALKGLRKRKAKTWTPEEWTELPQDYAGQLVQSMRQRCLDCVQARGGHDTHY
ncbi:transient-receptor-potential-like protein [Diadema antillarum]|uniref:transient-receptor-potential-like protein n=1 Tax=Diadema antillarum TaxID=105358 RepID=UPI003A8A4F08